MPVDHVEEALARLAEQDRRDPNIVALLTALVSPFNTLESAHQQLLTQRSVDTAIGAQLDVLGRIVNEARGGLDDETYRRYIRARIRTNRSQGVVEDLIRIAHLIVDDLNARIVVEQPGVAGVIVRVVDVAVTAVVADAAIVFLRAAVAAGVRLILETSIAAPAATFTLDGGAGLGFGIAAQLDLAPLTLNADTIVGARELGSAGNLLTLRFAHNGTGPVAGLLTNIGNAWTFLFRGGTTTVADFEAAIAASAVFCVHTPDGVGTLVAVGDVFDATALTGGVDGGLIAGASE